jgi:hypothetical protein
MPFFKEADVMYLHIPKTGGSSIDEYFYQKQNIPNNQYEQQPLYGEFPNCYGVFNTYRSMRHMTYSELFDHISSFETTFAKNGKSGREVFETLDFKHFIVSVRNPFDRILSELAWKNMIYPNYSKEEIENIVGYYLHKRSDRIVDNHKLPQYKFILDKDGNRLKNIQIIRCETLNEDMHSLGYIDFNIKANSTGYDTISLRKKLSQNAIKMICEYYKEDFEYFGYSKEI